MAAVPVELLHIESEIRLRLNEALLFHSRSLQCTAQADYSASVVAHLTEALMNLTKTKEVYYNQPTIP